MPLLMRRVERIIVFVNTRTPLTGGGPGEINAPIPAVFGQNPDQLENTVFPAGQYQHQRPACQVADGLGIDIVFVEVVLLLTTAHESALYEFLAIITAPARPASRRVTRYTGMRCTTSRILPLAA